VVVSTTDLHKEAEVLQKLLAGERLTERELEFLERLSERRAQEDDPEAGFGDRP
jgi:hypothetical protein